MPRSARIVTVRLARFVSLRDYGPSVGAFHLVTSLQQPRVLDHQGAQPTRRAAPKLFHIPGKGPRLNKSRSVAFVCVELSEEVGAWRSGAGGGGVWLDS